MLRIGTEFVMVALETATASWRNKVQDPRFYRIVLAIDIARSVDADR